MQHPRLPRASWLCLLLFAAPLAACAQMQQIPVTTRTWAGWSNSGPVTFTLSNLVTTNYLIVRRPALRTTLDPALLARLTNLPAVRTQTLSVHRATNAFFHHFEPASFSQHVWTNYLARTNGEAPMFRLADRASRPPHFEWNPHCWVAGLRGLTACSPMSEAEAFPGNGPGQLPITALTRRHGYTRGHSMGGESGKGLVGIKVWFVAPDNTTIERRVIGQQTRFNDKPALDYTLVLFDADLPASIAPLRVTTNNATEYPWVQGAPHPMAILEQGKTIQSGLAPYTGDTFKGGDSGSPVMIPLPSELVFIGGTSTSRPSPAMQADMDTLSRAAGLKPENYRLQYVDLTKSGR